MADPESLSSETLPSNARSSTDHHGETISMSKDKMKETEATTTTPRISGYHDLLQTLLDHVTLADHDFDWSSSSILRGGILLTGSAGVGKTFLVSFLAHCLTTRQTRVRSSSSHTMGSRPVQWKIHWNSVHSLWLRVAERPWATVEEIASWIAPAFPHNNDAPSSPEPVPGNDGSDSNSSSNMPMVRTLVVLDDLEVLLSSPKASSSSSGGDHDPKDNVVTTTTTARSSELQRLQAAVMHVLDHVITNPRLVQVIGMAQQAAASSSSSLAPWLTKVHRLDCHLHMEPPTQWQRQKLLETMLNALLGHSRTPPPQQPQQARDDEPRATTKIASETGNTIPTTTTMPQVPLWADSLATVTAGFVAGDLVHLCLQAHLRAEARLESTAVSGETAGENDPSTTGRVEWDDLAHVAQSMTPSQLEYLDVIRPPMGVTAPDSRDNSSSDTGTMDPRFSYRQWYTHHQDCWNGFIGYETLKKHVFRSIVLPWRQLLFLSNNKTKQQQGPTALDRDSTHDSSPTTTTILTPPRGVVFHGPSGCGKSLAATCLAASCGLPMIRVRPADILDKWLGGSEAALRSIFQRARGAAPCILFLDELDALATNRQEDQDGGGGGGGGGDTTGVMSRLLSTFLNELDGVTTLSSSGGAGRVLVVACTNRMESLDAALLRPGRLEEHVQVPPPSRSDVPLILRHYFSWPPKTRDTKASPLFVDNKVNLEHLAARLIKHNSSLDITAASLEGLAREAVLRCIRKQTMTVSDGDDDDHTDATRNDHDDDVFSPKLVSLADIEEAMEALHLFG